MQSRRPELGREDDLARAVRLEAGVSGGSHDGFGEELGNALRRRRQVWGRGHSVRQDTACWEEGDEEEDVGTGEAGAV